MPRARCVSVLIGIVALVAGSLVATSPAGAVDSATITGTVTDSATGNPIARAVVVFVDAAGAPAAATTANDGTYSIALVDGTYTRRVQAPGYTLLESSVNATGTMTSDAAIVAVSGSPKPLPTFGLPVQNASLVADSGTAGVFYAGSGFANTIYRTVDAGESWSAVTRASEDDRGISGTYQGFVRPAIATSGVAGEVATVSLSPTGMAGFAWISRDFGTTWKEVALPTGRSTELSGSVRLRWINIPGGAEFLVVQPATWGTTLWVADTSTTNPVFTEISAGVNPLLLTGGGGWDAWDFNGTPALAAVNDAGSSIDVYTWTDVTNVSSLTKLGSSIAVSPAIGPVSFFDVGGVNGSVMVVGGIDMSQPYPWPQTFGLVAKPAADANFDNAFVDSQSVTMSTCYLAGTGIVAPTATYEDARALVGVSACPVHADPDGDQSVTVGGATGVGMPAYDGEWDGATNQTVLGIAGRGIRKSTSESGSPAGPVFTGTDSINGITAPQVRSTTYGPGGPDQLAMTLDSMGGKRVIASDDGGATFTSVVEAGGWSSAWWNGTNGTWLVAGHSGAETGLLTAVSDWTSASSALAFPNLPSANQANMSPPGMNSDVRAVLGVEGTDTLFAGTFQYPGYMGSLYRGTLSGGDYQNRVAITSSDIAHPLATIQDLAYCPVDGSATNVAGALFVATGYLGLVNGGLYKVANALTAPAPVATPVSAFPFDTRPVTDVEVDCQTGSLTVGAASDPGVFHSDDGGATFDNVQFPDSDGGTPGTDTFQAAAIDSNPENPDQIVVIANEVDDTYGSGFMFETTDGGETWAKIIDPSAVDENGNQEAENRLVNDIALPPEEPPAPPQSNASQSSAPQQASNRELAFGVRTYAESNLVGPRAVSLAPLAIGTQAGGTALSLDVGGRRTPPGPATTTGATAGNARVRVTWNAPTQLGTRPITGYTAQCSASGKPTRTASTNSAGRQADVTGLVRGTQYSCRVRAQSALGGAAWSNSLNATTFNLPGVPRTVKATAQSKAVRLTFLAPTNNGGAAITKYRATCSAPGKPTRFVERNATTITVTGLVAGTKYSCRAQASNAVGLGTASAPVDVTPR